MSYLFSPFICFLSFMESAQVAVVVGIAVAVGPARATGLTDTLYDTAVGKICDSFVVKSVLEQFGHLQIGLSPMPPATSFISS